MEHHINLPTSTNISTWNQIFNDATQCNYKLTRTQWNQLQKHHLIYYVFVFNKPLFTMFTIQQQKKPSTSTNTNPKNKTKQQKIKIKPNFINSPITIRANKKNQIYRIWGL
jgi:hypothetical protein